MGITNALNNAVSGLNAVARAADVVSSNVSNALTDGYARRQLHLSSQTLGGDGAGCGCLASLASSTRRC